LRSLVNGETVGDEVGEAELGTEDNQPTLCARQAELVEGAGWPPKPRADPRRSADAAGSSSLVNLPLPSSGLL
jgi:hypothetical protein